MSQLEADIQDGAVTDPELAALTPPAIAGFNVTVSGARVGAPVPKTVSTGPYTGLFGLNQQIDITVHADDPQANRADAIVSVNAQSIPLFQFGVFYEGDLEIHNGPPMTFAGWVHTNGNLYLSSDNTFFQDLITTPQSVFWDRKAYADRRNGVWINNAAAVPVNLDVRQPEPADPERLQGREPGQLRRPPHDLGARRDPAQAPAAGRHGGDRADPAAVGGRRAGRAQGEGGLAGGPVREGGPEPARHPLQRHHLPPAARRPGGTDGRECALIFTRQAERVPRGP